MKTGLLAFAALALATSVTAHADENPFARSKAILQLKGIDLTTADGQQRLAIRLDQAARTVCGDRLATVHLALDAQARDCRAAVIADVRSQIDARMAAAANAKAVQVASR